MLAAHQCAYRFAVAAFDHAAPWNKRKSQEQVGAPDWIRTSDLQLRRLPLYPTELRARAGKS